LLPVTPGGLFALSRAVFLKKSGDAMHVKIDVFEKPIVRIKKTCELMGFDLEAKLPELETYLEGLVAEGETDEGRLTVSGLTFLKGNAK
jgi:hypothetical protein